MDAQVNIGAESEYDELYLYIDGEWVSAEDRDTSPVINPATGKVIGRLPHAAQADLDRALAAAEQAFTL